MCRQMSLNTGSRIGFHIKVQAKLRTPVDTSRLLTKRGSRNSVVMRLWQLTNITNTL